MTFKYIYYSILAQISLKHLWCIAKAVLTVVGFCVTFLQSAEYLSPEKYVAPVVTFCKMNLRYELMLIVVSCMIYKWKKLGYVWKCKDMELLIEIKCCDFFSQKGAKIIQFSNTFDTDIHQKKLVKSDSVNGQFILRYYEGDIPNLDDKIYRQLREHVIPSKYNGKLRGKKMTYPIGTICPMTIQRNSFFLTAFSKMRPNGNASMSKIEYSDFLVSLWKNLSCVSIQDEVINITVFGASSVSGLPADFKYQDKLHEIIKSFLLASKNQRLCKKLRICMRAEDYKQFDYEDCKLLAAYFDSHLSQIFHQPWGSNKRGTSFNPAAS